jgi:hypothetical protein
MSRRPDQNFAGDSECALGMVHCNDEFCTGTHVCLNCGGKGCKQKKVRADVRERRAELLKSLSGAVVMSDQKGRMVLVDVERGTCHVMEEA